MKIGASTLSGFKDKLDDNFKYFESIGIEYAEILHQFPNDHIDMDIFDNFSLKYSVHSPLLNINIASLNESIRKASIQEIKKSIDLANEINADTVVVHPGAIPFLGRDYADKIYNLAIDAFKELKDYGDEYGVNPAIENMPTFEGYMYTNIYDLAEIMNELEMAMTLDIGHAAHSGYSSDDMYFDCVKHMHIHDNNGDDDSHFALGEGSINIKDIINKYEKNNYDGIYVIEVNEKDWINKSLEYLDNM